MASPSNVVKKITSNDIKWVDVQFTDLLGKMHRFSVSGPKITDKTFSKGVEGPNLDEVFGYSEDPENLILVPDSSTFARIPWENTTARLIANAKLALSKEQFLGDPRYVTEHMQVSLKAAGITAARISSSVEFYIFDNVTADKSNTGQGSSYLIDTREGVWNPSPLWNSKSGAYMNAPFDTSSPLRNQIADAMNDNFGYNVEYHSHGRGATNQQNIKTGLSLLTDAADAFATMKYVARNAAVLTNSLATFMPLPIVKEKGSATHVEQTLWKKDRNVFYDANGKYAQLSQNARYYIGGILEHAHALCVFTNPTTNSYKRLRVDPYYVGWSKYNVGSMVKVPHVIANSDLDKRVSVVSSDSSMNAYLAYPALIAAGLDGIKKKIDPGDPADKMISKMSAKDRRDHKISELPGSLMGALEGLQSDNKFLKGVIPQEMLDTLIEVKLNEISEMDKRIGPDEMKHYFNF